MEQQETPIRCLADVLEVQRQHAEGKEVPKELLKACIEFLREERKTPSAKGSTKKAKEPKAASKPKLTLDDII
jgi:hypothetical protein